MITPPVRREGFPENALTLFLFIGKPGIFDFKGRYKWEAWTKNKGMSKEEAQAKYIAHVAVLKSKYSS